MYARRPASIELVRIKDWNANHEAVVLAHLAGTSLSEIAATSGFSYAWVSTILKTNQAKAMIEKVRKNTQVDQEGTITDRLARIREKSLQRIEKFVVEDGDKFYQASPFAFFDRMMTVSKGVGLMASPSAGTNINVTNNTQNINQTNVLSSDQANQLLKAFNMSNEVALLHPGEVPDNVG